MEKFFDTFAKIPTLQKVLGVVLFVFVVGALTYFLSISGKQGQIAALETEDSTQKTEIAKLREQAERRAEFQREVERLKERLREAEERLPKSAELDKVLRDVDYEAKQAGLRVDRFEPQPEAQDATAGVSRVPLKMTVRGNYHELAVFLDRIAKMSRIVNITDLMMDRPATENSKVVVAASYTATTFRFLEPEVAPKETKPKPKAAATADE
jgi:type IV pilus assembly protein PilO